MPVVKNLEIGAKSRNALYQNLLDSLNLCEDEESLMQWEDDSKSDISAIEESDVGRIAPVADLIKQEVEDRRTYLKMKKEFTHANS